MTTSAAPRNQLDLKQNYLLTKWIEKTADDHQDHFHDTVAQAATKALGFTVTKANIAAARKVAGVTYPSRNTHGNGKGGRAEKVYYVARDLLRVMRELGIEPSEELARIGRKQSLTKED